MIRLFFIIRENFCQYYFKDSSCIFSTDIALCIGCIGETCNECKFSVFSLVCFFVLLTRDFGGVLLNFCRFFGRRIILIHMIFSFLLINRRHIIKIKISTKRKILSIYNRNALNFCIYIQYKHLETSIL